MRPNKPNPPVLLTTSHKVGQGRLSDFSVGARGLVSAAQRSPGCLGGSISGSPDDDRIWQIVCRFTDEAAADAWARSSSNARWGRYMQKYSMPLGVTFSNGVTPLDQSTAQSMSPVYSDDYDEAGAPVVPSQGKRRVVLAVFVFIVFFGAVIVANGMAVKMLPNVPPLVRILVLCFAMTGLAAWVLPPLLGKGGGRADGAPPEPKEPRKRSKKAPEINAPRTRRRAPEVDRRGRRIESERDLVPPPAPVADPPRVGGRRGKQAPQPMPASSTLTTIEPVGPPPQARRRAERRPVAAAQSAQREQRGGGRGGQQLEPVRLRPLNIDATAMMEAPTPPPAAAPLPAPRGGFFPTSPHKESRN